MLGRALFNLFVAVVSFCAWWLGLYTIVFRDWRVGLAMMFISSLLQLWCHRNMKRHWGSYS